MQEVPAAQWFPSRLFDLIFCTKEIADHPGALESDGVKPHS
jgi:hypothetical protein